jgi:hypothetical protein
MAPTLPLVVHAAKVPAEYRALHRYLNDRYADTVVLSFDQIEALMDARLPEPAHHADWWATAPYGSAPSPQSHAWADANRTALPNFPARHVVFERLSKPRPEAVRRR